ncbi:MAG: ABC transporter ATP-binding protein [Bosea sp.]|jgi:multiple sugar transport system ATP-binding protein|nr:ABC transporter ATP-binding protein [Bosea sp. (in: a-proteobacteria)]
MSGIVLQDIHKSFGTTNVLRGVSVSVAPGEFLSLVGPSGCGKTTLMRIIAGLEAVGAGSVEIGGRQVTGLRAADRDVAMVFQNYALYPHLTVRQNIGVPLIMRRLSAAERIPLMGGLLPGVADKRRMIEADVAAAAEMLGIGKLLARKPAQLSGGQRQRVALGRAIVRRPKAFLMDEPLSNLDAALRVTTRSEIVALHRRVGASTVYVTHDQSEAMTMSDRVAVMMEGQILQIGSPEEIYADPADLRVARFIGSPSINVLAAELDVHGHAMAGGVALGLMTRLPGSGPVLLAVRPEDLSLAPSGIAARVTHLEYLGESLLVHALVRESDEAVVCRLAPEMRRRVARGEMVHLRPDPAKAMLFDGDGRRLASHAREREHAHG